MFWKTKISYPLISTCGFRYHGVRSASFSENLVNILKEQFLVKTGKFWK